MFEKNTLYKVDNETYHTPEFPGISRSQLQKLIVNPNSFKRKISNTKALNFGSVFHDFILLPHEFKDTYFLEPKRPEGLKLTTKEGRAWKASLVEQAAGKKIVGYDDVTMLINMKRSLQAHSVTKFLFDYDNESHVYEKGAFTTSPYGVNLKAKFDLACMNTETIFDLKTVTSTSSRDIYSSVRKYFYDFQAYFYRNVLAGVTQIKFDFVFIFVEKSYQNPDIRVFRADDKMFDSGQEIFYESLERYSAYLEKGLSDNPYLFKNENHPEKFEMNYYTQERLL